MRRRVAIIASAVLPVFVVATVYFPRESHTSSRVYSVSQFVQAGSGPFWTTKSTAVYYIRGILRRVPMQPIANYVLSDNGSTSTGSGGIALSSGPSSFLIGALLRVAPLRRWLPHSPDNPLLGVIATYRVTWIGCPANGCYHSPWQLDSGG